MRPPWMCVVSNCDEFPNILTRIDSVDPPCASGFVCNSSRPTRPRRPRTSPMHWQFMLVCRPPLPGISTLAIRCPSPVPEVDFHFSLMVFLSDDHRSAPVHTPFVITHRSLSLSTMWPSVTQHSKAMGGKKVNEWGALFVFLFLHILFLHTFI